MKSSLLIALLLLAAFPARSNESGHPVTLWQVAGETNSVYLLGSIHLLRSEDYPLPTILDVVYNDAEVLFMEIDMDDMNPFAAQTAFTTHGVIQDEKTLQDLIGDESYAQALAAAEAIDFPLDMLSKTEPWYAAMTVEIMMLGRIGFNPALGIEMYMMSKASADNKPIEGFETVEQQVLFLDGMSLDAQREMLLSTLSESAKMSEMMDELIAAWRFGDVSFLESGMLVELAKHEELHKALVTDRNARWVAQIDELLDDEDDYLIIVGALHLVGPDSVPRQLQNTGYDVQQLSEPPPLR